MTKQLITIMCAVALIVSACVADLEPVSLPVVDYTSELRGMLSFDSTARRLLSGVYKRNEGTTRFGDRIAVAYDGQVVTMYTVRGVAFFTLRGGIANDSVKLVGVWRGVQGSETGIARLSIRPSEGGREIAEGKGNGLGLILRGEITTSSGSRESYVIEKVDATNLRQLDFEIIAHRGGGRNSERLGVSENSIPMVLLAGRLGATAVEVDIQRTRDGEPIIFHDPTFTARTVPSPYVIGDVDNYTLRQLKAVARLVNGETIPPLDEMLDVIVDSTELRLVWLDVKAPSVMDAIMASRARAVQRAQQRGRNVDILIGIPDDATFSAVKNSALYSSLETDPKSGTLPILCELGVDRVREVNARVWAPRFTAGLQSTLVAEMKKEKRRCFVWTVDDQNFISDFVSNGEFDGILTNYPTLLAAMFYTSPKGR